MRGDLSETTVADLCRGLSAAGATGAVEVADHAGDARIFFRAGDVYWAVSPTPRARLGDRLVNAGLLSQEQLDEALEAQRSSAERTKLGALLVERGLVSRDAIRVFVQEQILDAIFEMVQWHEGAYVFNPGEVADEKLPIDIPVDQVLVEVSRRQSEWAQIGETIPDLDMIPEFVTGGSSANAALEPDEFAMLANVDGARSIRDLADHLGYSEFEAARIVYGLTLLGIVQVASADDEDADVDVASALEEAIAGAGPSADAPPPVDRPRPSVKLHVDPEVRDYLPPHGPAPTAEDDEPAVAAGPAPVPEVGPEVPEVRVPAEGERSIDDLTAALTAALEGPTVEPRDVIRDLFDEVPPGPGPTADDDGPPPPDDTDVPLRVSDDDEPEDAWDDEPEPWVATADDEPSPTPDLGFFTEPPATTPREGALDDDDFDALLSELGAPDATPAAGAHEPPDAPPGPPDAPAEPPPESPESPAEPTVEHAEPAAEPPPAEPAAEQPPVRRSSPGGDVSEFLRELSQLAIDEPPASANPGPTRPPAEKPAAQEEGAPSEPAAASREEDRRQAADKRDERNKKRGLFGWGR